MKNDAAAGSGDFVDLYAVKMRQEPADDLITPTTQRSITMNIDHSSRDRTNYVSRLARELGISRALLQVHLRKLEAVGLVSSDLELSEDGKALKFYEVVPFDISLTPNLVEDAARTLSDPDSPDPAAPGNGGNKKGTES